MSSQLTLEHRETNDTLRALRRAARRALTLGLETGTPVYVIKNNRIVDLTTNGSRLKKQSTRSQLKK